LTIQSGTAHREELAELVRQEQVLPGKLAEIAEDVRAGAIKIY